MDTTPTPTLNQFLEYRQLKSKERTNFSISKKGASSKHEQKKVQVRLQYNLHMGVRWILNRTFLTVILFVFLQINVGIMCLQSGALKPQRGKTLPLLTDPQITAKDLLRMAEKNSKTLTKTWRKDPTYFFIQIYLKLFMFPGHRDPLHSKTTSLRLENHIRG